MSNIHNRNKLYSYQQRTYSDVAQQNYVFEGKFNTIIISTEETARLSHQEVKKSISRLQNQFRFSFNFDLIGRMLVEKPTWDAFGDILTDDYSPVNVLKSKNLKHL